MKLLRELFWVSRPVSWINTAFPFAAAYFLIGGRVDATLVVGTLFFLIPYNLLMYGVNDVFDYESDMRNPRKGSIEGSVLAPRWHRAILGWAFGLTAPFVIWMALGRNLQNILILAFVVFMVIAYSMKGMRFKEKAFLDSFTSACHFAGPMVVGIAFAGGNPLSPVSILLTSAFLLWGMASHAFGAVQDIVADREGGLASIATILGAKTTVRLALAAYVLAAGLLLFGPWPMALGAIPLLVYPPMVWPFRNLTDDQCEQANRGWKKFIALNYIAGFLVTMLLIANQLGLI